MSLFENKPQLGFEKYKYTYEELQELMPDPSSMDLEEARYWFSQINGRCMWGDVWEDGKPVPSSKWSLDTFRGFLSGFKKT